VAAERPRVLLARGLLYWRWSMLGAALEDLRGAASAIPPGGSGGGGGEGVHADAGRALLALLLCLSRWDEAQRLAHALGEQRVAGLVEKWFTAAEKMRHLFLPKQTDFCPEDMEVVPGVVRADVRVPVEGAELGVRLLLRTAAGDGRAFAVDRPLLLCFHSEEENVDSYSDASFLDYLDASRASAVVAGFRGYGFSTGSPACLASIRTDGDAIADALPGIFAQRGLPWPWPGKLVLYGNSIGSRVACYLAGLRGETLFTGGVILESAWCGSYAPGAKPLPEPPRHMALAAMGSNSMGDSRFGSREMNLASAAVGREAARLLLPAKIVGGVAHMCFVRGNEDLLRGYGGRLLLLHGELDHVVPAEHARRLCAAAEAAQRRLVLVAGKRFDSLRQGPEYRVELRRFLDGR